MYTRAATTGKRAVLSVLLGILSLLIWSTAVWASTRVGDAELQMWYRQRQTFHTDGGQHFDWDQWRNEIFGWFIYDPLVDNGRLFGQMDVPLVQHAVLNARYRFRFDPVYLIRDHFGKIYNNEERDNFVIPENGFRDLFADFDFGHVGPGSLSLRVGNQQIVWGEADLFRSLDIINPLRIDQNTFAGEKFDEFRTPILALKGLYSIGNVGTWFSDVAIEPWYSPRFLNATSHLIAEGAFRLPSVHERGCLDDNNNLIPFDIHRCSQARADGSRLFVPWRPAWIGHRRQQNPWSFLAAMGPTQKIAFDDGIALNHLDSPDVFGQRASMVFQKKKGSGMDAFNGSGGVAQGGGVRRARALSSGRRASGGKRADRGCRAADAGRFAGSHRTRHRRNALAGTAGADLEAPGDHRGWRP